MTQQHLDEARRQLLRVLDARRVAQFLASAPTTASRNPERNGASTPNPVRARWMSLREAASLLDVHPERLKSAISRVGWNGNSAIAFDGIVVRKLGQRYRIYLDSVWVDPDAFIRASSQGIAGRRKRVAGAPPVDERDGEY